jgi:hypothetical protein
MDNFVARGKLPAGLKHRLVLQQLRVVACCGLSFCEGKSFKDFITLLRPNYTPASESALRLTNTRADFEIAMILGQQLSTGLCRHASVCWWMHCCRYDGIRMKPEPPCLLSYADDASQVQQR